MARCLKFLECALTSVMIVVFILAVGAFAGSLQTPRLWFHWKAAGIAVLFIGAFLVAASFVCGIVAIAKVVRKDPTVDTGRNCHLLIYHLLFVYLSVCLFVYLFMCFTNPYLCLSVFLYSELIGRCYFVCVLIFVSNVFLLKLQAVRSQPKDRR